MRYDTLDVTGLGLLLIFFFFFISLLLFFKSLSYMESGQITYLVIFLND